MKKITAISIVLAILLLFTMPVFTVRASSYLPQIEASVIVSHEIRVLDGGLVVVNDTLSINNTGTEPISSFLIGFPENFSGNLDYASAYGPQGESLGITLGANMTQLGLYGINVTFPQPIGQGSSYNFTLTCVFSSLIKFIEGKYNVTFPMYPSLTLDAVSCNATVVLPEGLSLVNSSWLEDDKPVLREVMEPLTAFSNQTGFVTFSGAIKLLECNRAGREIIFDPWGTIYVFDYYNLRNVGGVAISDMELLLPEGARDIKGYDIGGAINVTSEGGSEGGFVKAVVKLRYPLKGSPSYESCGFTVEYALPASLHVNQVGLWNYRLDLELFSNFNWTIRELIVTVKLPEGAQYVDASPTGSVAMKDLQQVVTYKIENVTPFHNLDLNVEYRYIVFWSAFRPILWAGLIVAALSVVVVFQRFRKPPAPPILIPVDLIRDFVEVCDERIALRLELESMERDLERGKIRKRDYKKRRKSIDRSLATLSKEFSSLKKKVRDIAPRFAEAVKKIEVAETEFETVRANINKIEIQYRAGKISKDAYEKLVREYEKRLDKAKTTIDSVIIALRGEIR